MGVEKGRGKVGRSGRRCKRQQYERVLDINNWKIEN
jgi:hypothetical protein